MYKIASITIIFISFAILLTHTEESMFKVIKIDASDSMKTHAFGTALLAFESTDDPNQVATKLATEFNEVYGRHWFCLVGPEGFMSHFDAINQTLIWFSYGATQIILFKPSQLTSHDIILEARRERNITIIKSEMGELMKQTALLILTIAIKSYEDFASIGRNITSTFDTLYGQYWQCFLGGKHSEADIKYVSGYYLDVIIDELEIFLYKTSQPQLLLDQESVIVRARTSTVMNVDSLVGVDNATRDGMVSIGKDAIKTSTTYTQLATNVRNNVVSKYGAGVWGVMVSTWAQFGDSWNVTVKRQITFHLGDVRFNIFQIS